MSRLNLDDLRRQREAAMAAGFASGKWVQCAQELFAKFPDIYATAQTMNAEAAQARELIAQLKGQHGVLAKLLQDAVGVLRTVEPSDGGIVEADMLEALIGNAEKVLRDLYGSSVVVAQDAGPTTSEG